MEPTPQYPNGYVRFYNEHGQPVGLDGNPGPNSATHIQKCSRRFLPDTRGMMIINLGFHGQSVISEDFGYTVALNLSGGYEIRIETDFSLHDSDGDLHVSPGVDPDVNSGRLRALAGHTITTSIAENSGVLRVDFGNGARLRVEPDDRFDAWTVAGPNGMKVACMPGGELAVWSAETNQQHRLE